MRTENVNKKLVYELWLKLRFTYPDIEYNVIRNEFFKALQEIDVVYYKRADVPKMLTRIIYKQLDNQEIEKLGPAAEFLVFIVNYFGVTLEDLKTPTKAKNNKGLRKEIKVTAREFAMYGLRYYYKFSLKRIGEELGHRDHSTVIHNLRKLDDRLATEKLYKRYLKDVEDFLKSSFIQSELPLNTTDEPAKFPELAIAEGMDDLVASNSVV